MTTRKKMLYHLSFQFSLMVLVFFCHGDCGIFVLLSDKQKHTALPIQNGTPLFLSP